MRSTFPDLAGVTFAQMTVSSFLIFIPALIGRLATGVLLLIIIQGKTVLMVM